MTQDTSNSKRLARNTLVLYVRTMIIMVIGLYTSRVLLNALGIDNFGVYDVIGGFVGMFGVISASLVATTQRYISVEVGKGENGDTKKIFSVVLGIHFLLALLMLVILETVGLWFLNYRLNIPPDRVGAAHWVYQICVATSVLSLFSTPYIGLIVAYERMRAFAFISMQDAVLKLIICCLLYILPFDRLISYAALFGFVILWDQCVYVFYSYRNFKEARFSFIRQKDTYKSMLNFAGMNFLGSFSYILSTQGVNVILNIFFGVPVNAARGIATQVQNAVGKFTGDFMTALNPQITKEYAAGNIDKSFKLCLQGAKFSYYIMLFFAIPIFVRAHEILYIWLGQYPNYTIAFLRLTLLISLVGVMAQPFVTQFLATGNLKKITWWIGGTRLLVLPLVYISFKFLSSPIWAYIVVLLMDSTLLFVRLRLLEDITRMKMLQPFFSKVFIRVLMVSIITATISFGLTNLISETFVGLIIFAIASVIMTGVCVFAIGLTKIEKSVLVNYAKKKLNASRNINI